MGEKICQAAWDRGAKVVLLPTIPYGTQTNQMQFPMTMNLNPATLAIVLGRPGRVARSARHPEDRTLEQPRRQRPQAGAAGALRPDPGQAIPVQLVHGLQGSLQRHLLPARRPCRRGRDLAHAGLLSRVGRAERRRHAGGRRGPGGPLAVRGGQSRLGFDHPALASLDHQQRLRQSARRDGRQGPAV